MPRSEEFISMNWLETSFLKFYAMRNPEIDLYEIAHVKLDLIAHQKMYVIPILGRSV